MPRFGGVFYCPKPLSPPLFSRLCREVTIEKYLQYDSPKNKRYQFYIVIFLCGRLDNGNCRNKGQRNPHKHSI